LINIIRNMIWNCLNKGKNILKIGAKINYICP